jgi:transcriptional regulator with XRE-family HTH domain
MVTFAERLKEVRARAGFSQSHLESKSGVPAGTIRNYEQGIRKPSLSAGIKLAKALGISADVFADCEDIIKDESPPARKRAKKAGKGKT